MKAAVRTRYGPPEVVRIAEVDKPAPKDNEVLVRVHATTVNRTDCGVRAAKPFLYRFLLGLTRPKLTVLGTEFAGEIEAVGGGVTSFQVGDRVFGFNGSSFGAHADEEVAPSTEGAHYASPGSGGQGSSAATTSSCTAPPAPSARPRSSCCAASTPR